MKKIITIALLSAMAAFAGCKTTEANVQDGPVAPEQYSNEKSNTGDPQLPYMIPWWKFQ